MSIIILSRDDEGGHRGAPHELADEILEDSPDEVVRIVKGPISGVKVSDAAAVRWLMRTYTANGNLRKGK